MNNGNHLIDLNGLKTFLDNLWTKIKGYVDPLFEATNKKVDAATWVGKEEDIPAAIESGAIIPGYTLVTVTNDDEQEKVFTFATKADIYALFGLVPTV